MAYLLRCNPPCYFVLLSSSRTVVVAYSWFVGEDFGLAGEFGEGMVGVEVEGAGAHKVDMGLLVERRPRGVAVKMLAGRTRHQFGLRLILVADLT